MADKRIARSLNEILPLAEEGGYAVGSFSPRCIPLIRPVLSAGQKANSPIIVQISPIEVSRYDVTLKEFAEEFYRELEKQDITIPVTLHLDHTRKFEVIQTAIAVGFSSVMIDASDKPLAENIAITRRVVEYAHPFGVSVEGELGRIRTADFVETDTDEELYTNPIEAKRFVEETNVDALAVSIGTVHGVYKTRQPKLDLELLQNIREHTPVHLVLHGGSGVSAESIRASISLPGGGISKVNIATELELAALEPLGRKEYLTNQEMSDLPAEKLAQVRAAVEKKVLDKIQNFLGSFNSAQSG